MVSVFGDDSEDETKQRVFAVAGVIATEKEWERLESEWKDRTGNVPFHATDCESNHGDYTKNSNAENKNLYRDLTQMLAKSEAFGFGVALDLAGHRRFCPGVPHEYCYHRAFIDVVLAMRNIAKAHFGDSVKFTFDTRVESKSSSGILYGLIVEEEAHTEPISHLFEELSFACSKKQPRIQVGDLLARETMKDLDNVVGPKRRPRRKSMDALVESGRFFFRNYYAEWFSRVGQLMPGLELAMGTSYLQYLRWLSDSKLVDNPTNRFRYLSRVAQAQSFRFNFPPS
jgi:hypothetical protein